MLKLNRFVLTCAGTALVVAACAAPTDPDRSSAAPAEEPSATGAAESDVAITEADLDRSDEADPEAAPDYPHDRRWYGGMHRHRCNQEDAWHCRRGHRGWRWQNDGYGGGYGDGHRGRRCCVRAVDRPHRGHW